MTISVILVDAVTGEPDYDGRELRGPMSPIWFGKTAAKPLGARSGVAWGTLTDTITVSGTTVTIGPHTGVLDLQTALEASVYLYANDDDVELEHDAAHATLARIDIICALLDDPAESDGSSAPAVTFTYTAGTAAGSPTPPATPARSMVLAHVNVPASGGGASTITWKAPYAVASGGIIPVRDDTERDALAAAYPGTTDAPLVIWHKADATFYYNDGTGWETLGDTSAVEAEIALRARYTYRPADAAALAALTGMRAGDIATQIDTGVDYRYSGAAWVIVPRIVASGSFAAAATATIDSISGYNEYEIILDIPTCSTANEMTAQLRAGGVTQNANYDFQLLFGSATTATAAGSFAQTAVTLGGGARTDKHYTIRLTGLNAAARTVGTLQGAAKNAGANAQSLTLAIWHTAATACDGIIFTASTGTITGTYIVRGLA